MIKSIFVAVLLGLILTAPIEISAADQWTGNANLTLGMKYLDDVDWDPVDDQGEIGISFDFRHRDWPVSIALGLLASAEEDDYDVFDIEGSTSEVRLGIRKIWEPDLTMRPFFGAGLAYVDAEYEVETSGQRVSADDSGLGFWFEGGIYWTLNTKLNLGFNIGYSDAEVTFLGSDAEAGGSHLALILGYHW